MRKQVFLIALACSLLFFNNKVSSQTVSGQQPSQATKMSKTSEGNTSGCCRKTSLSAEFQMRFGSRIINHRYTDDLELAIKQAEEIGIPILWHPEANKFRLPNDPESFELIELRDEYSRTYVTSQGNFAKTQSFAPMHFNKNGYLVSYDNTMKLSAQGSGLYEMKATDMPVSIDLQSGKITMQLTKTGGKISFGDNSSMGFASADGKILNTVDHQNTFTRQTKANVVHFVEYWPQTSKKHSFGIDRVKIDYVIHSPYKELDAKGYVFFNETIILPNGWNIAKGNGIQTKIGWKGNLHIVDENGHIQGYVDEAVFYDSSPQTTKKSNSSITGTYLFAVNGNIVSLTTVVDARWLNDPQRVYPVIIDPSISNLYTTGNINTLFQSPWVGPSTCPGLMTVTIPTGSVITGTDAEYKMVATIGGGGWRSEQRSRVSCTNAGGVAEGAYSVGYGNSEGTYYYNRYGLSIANGVAGGGAINFRLDAGRLWGGSGCNATYNYVENNSWKMTVHFNWVDPCPNPTGLNVINITNNSARLQWTEAGSATQWRVQWGPKGFNPASAGSSANTSNQYYNVTGLTQCTDYDFYVRAICGVGDTSFIRSGPFSFRTTGSCTYLHGTNANYIQGTYLMACMETIDCGTTHRYYDNGGPAGNYSDGIGAGGYGPYRTFCPNSPGNCIRATVNSMNIEGNGSATCYDWLIVQNGPTQTSPYLWRGCETQTAPITYDGSWNGGQWTSTSTSGCLSFAFYSDGLNNRAGWDITLSCVPCAQHNLQTSSECGGAIPTCGDTAFVGSSTGPGIESTCNSCLISENFTTWYYFEITNPGLLALTIQPINVNDDYDFVIFRATDCNNLGQPVRCSYAMNTGNTGLRATHPTLGYAITDHIEDVQGDAWLAPLPVQAGEMYMLMVNGWTDSDMGYNLDFNLSGGGTFQDCDSLPTLPVEFVHFDGQCNNGKTNLQWATASESNNDYFTVLKSYNGFMFKTIGWVLGQGNSNQLSTYSYTDDEEESRKVYYQLKQTDFDGTISYSKIIVVECGHVTEFALTVADNTDNGYIEALFNAIPNVQYNITLVDATGKTVYSESISGDDFIKHKISTETLSQGIYVLNVHSQANSHSQKVMIVSN